jgi:hypothetical protein
MNGLPIGEAALAASAAATPRNAAAIAERTARISGERRTSRATRP